MRDSDQAPQAHGVPKWVKLFAIIGAVVALGLVVMLLAGHDPGRHLRNSGSPVPMIDQ
jgi:hypothetical protein